MSEKYWAEVIAARPPLYGADVDGSLFPPPDEAPLWNLRKLPDILREGPTALPPHLLGVVTPKLNFGQWRSTFALHTKDADLFSIDYLHSGASKMWVGCPARAADLVEMLAAQSFPKQACHTCMHTLGAPCEPTSGT